jgi:glycerate-2-kinase
MSKSWINNKPQLATTAERELVLNIAEAGLTAIDTDTVMREFIKLDGQTLTVNDQTFNLAKYKRVLVLGFGKASGKAAKSLDDILGNIITDGVVISLKKSDCKHIRTFVGTHPLPSLENLQVAEQMAELIKNVSADDLVICLVSGGGSALLTWTKEECDQGIKLYNSYLKTGDDILGLNTVRKHISQAKGGGLAKMLYPATVIGLIFSDVAGHHTNMVDSGPTFKDDSTVADAQAIIDKYQLGDFVLNETPKEDKYFTNVHNITVVSNVTALHAMKDAAEQLGHKAVIVSEELFDPPHTTMQKMLDAAEPGTIVLGGSEIKITVTKSGGRGGRNTYLATYALLHLTHQDTFAAVASDGLDNSDCAGAIVDAQTKQAAHNKIQITDYLENFDGYSLFEKTGHELIFTGPTEANVSDYLILYRK